MTLNPDLHLTQLNDQFEIDWLKRWALYSPNKPALTCGDTGRSLNYEQFFRQACIGADFLKRQYHIQKGDRVLLMSTNEIYTFVLFFALSRLGATLVPINYRLTESEVKYLIDDSQPTLIVYEQQYLETLKKISSGRPLLSLVGDAGFEQACLRGSFEECEAKNYFYSVNHSSALIIYTSGTTGFPKGAMISHQALFWNSINTSLRLNITESDAAVIFLPLFHTGGWNVLSTPFFHRGAHIILNKKFEADQILNLSEKFKCTLLFGVPTTMSMMSVSQRFQSVNLSHVRYAIVGGEPMPIPEIEKWHSKKIPIRQGYGLTEFGPNVFSLNESDSIRKMGSIGFPNFYVEVSVRDDQNRICVADEVGELWLKGPMAMTGYWNKPEATESTFHEGWLKTGDLVRFDSENYFYVVGRKKEMYKSGGENVYPAEIEKVLAQYPGVREAAVIGVKDPQWGEVGHAFISLNEGVSYSETDLREYLVKNLAKFKNPKFVTVLKELPKGDSGKILKRKLIDPHS